jgi:hypothetical protein
MHWILLSILLIFAGALYKGYEYVLGLPQVYYSSWILGEKWNKYYELPKYNSLLLQGNEINSENLIDYKEDYPQLWKLFQLGHLNLPLPVRHPLYQTIPIIQFADKKTAPLLGISLHTPEKKKLISIYLLKSSLHKDYSFEQELFKLPYFRNKMNRLSKEVIWEDIFSREIKAQENSIDEMIRSLYILHIRSKLIPQNFVKYGMVSKTRAFIELNSKNKDFKYELILENSGNRIFSYFLETNLQNEDAIKLRAKYLKELTPKFVDISLARILYTEFKQLNFSRQFDQEGLLYLFSAWSQDINQLDLFKEMIFYMERGRNSSEQLKVLYEYAFKKYGKTFTTRNIFNDTDDPNLTLQRKIEIEQIEKRAAAELNTEQKTIAEPAPSIEENSKNELKKAKEMGEKKGEGEVNFY